MRNIAIIGFGVVGSGVAEVIRLNTQEIKRKLNDSINIKYILDKRTFPDHPLGDRVVSDIDIIINDSEVELLVETMGGSHPAYEFSKKALENGKSVVTSNKEVVANFGAELMRLARENNASYMFEASVGGGIPIIRPMWQCLAANKIESVSGILNGTCNYILTQMASDSKSFDEVLSEAQALGYAERDPSADVDGVDTARKISILSSLATGKGISPDKIHTEGIRGVIGEDFEMTSELGYKIKLLGRYENTPDGIYVITAPFAVSNNMPIAQVDDVYNAITVCGNVLGDATFVGKGAGSLPTASAVTADIIDALANRRLISGWENAESTVLADICEHKYSYYVRTTDTPDNIKKYFGTAEVLQNGKYLFFVTPEMKESTFEGLSSQLNECFSLRIL